MRRDAAPKGDWHTGQRQPKPCASHSEVSTTAGKRKLSRLEGLQECKLQRGEWNAPSSSKGSTSSTPFHRGNTLQDHYSLMPHPEVSCVVSKEAHRAFAIGGKLAQLGPEPLGVQPVPAANSSQHRQRMSLLVVESWNRSGCMLPAPGAAPQLLASMFHCCLYCCPGSAAGRSGLGYGFYRDTYWAFVVLLHRLKPLPNSTALTQIGCAR